MKNSIDRPLDGVASVTRALNVLSCFEQGDDALSLAEMARRTGIVKSTILRIISSFTDAGYLIRINDQYVLGSEIVRLHAIYSSSQGMEAIISPILSHLAYVTKETATFYIEQQGQRLCLYRANSPLTLRLDISPGSFRPMDNASSAKILRLFRKWPDEQPGLPAMPIYTAGATDPHAASMSGPVLGQGDRLVGAVSLTGPMSRLTWEAAKRYEDDLMAACVKISAALGSDLGSVFRAVEESPATPIS
ncbi:helix-turn-helix domain-containing protein [Novosphingobium sp. 11B]